MVLFVGSGRDFLRDWDGGGVRDLHHGGLHVGGGGQLGGLSRHLGRLGAGSAGRGSLLGRARLNLPETGMLCTTTLNSIFRRRL